MSVCQCLRWKGYHRALQPEEIELAFQRNHVPYTCLHTGQPWGPDGDVAAPEACASGRDCFEASETLIARVRRARRSRGAAP
ncbi:MAG: hypothetical protein U0166_11390 [Acidobacteriota bacterium]